MKKALIITEDVSRREFLNQHLEKSGYYGVWYPNIFAYRKAIEIDPIEIIVADLMMPIEPMIDLIKRGAKKNPMPKLITIGKEEYLKSSNILKNYPMVISLKKLSEFPSII